MSDDMDYLFDKYTNEETKAINKLLNGFGYKLIIKRKHVYDRLRERGFDSMDFIRGLRELLKTKLCQLIYHTSLETPRYSFEYRINGMIIIIGLHDGERKNLTIRTVLDPKEHNKYGDEGKILSL